MNDRKRSTIAEFADLLIIGIMFAMCIGVGLFMGLQLDKWLGTNPWLTLVFLLLGIAAGFINMFRTIARQK